MKYHKSELEKLGITEADIQEQRDKLLKGLTLTDVSKFIIPIKKIYLPFVIDMVEDNVFECEPFGIPGVVKLTVTI